jgi:hypothetical protein
MYLTQAAWQNQDHLQIQPPAFVRNKKAFTSKFK